MRIMGVNPGFQNSYLTGRLRNKGKTRLADGVAPSSGTTSQALTRISSNDTKSVFDSATSILIILVKYYLRAWCFLRYSHYIRIHLVCYRLKTFPCEATFYLSLSIIKWLLYKSKGFGRSMKV